jgi:hypothetical protein
LKEEPVQPRNIIIGVLLAMAGPWCAAQAVYRCGSSSYSTEPCAGGTLVDTAHNGSTASEAARAIKSAEGDAKRADAMEKARLAQEKNAPRAIIIAPAEPPQAAASEKKKNGKKGKAGTGQPEQFTAKVPGTGKAKNK